MPTPDDDVTHTASDLKRQLTPKGVGITDLLALADQWPPADETDPDVIDGVQRLLDTGIDAAMEALGVTEIERLGDNRYVFSTTPLHDDCLTCLHGRMMLAGAAVNALLAARLLAHTEDRSSPEFDRELRGYLDKISECKSREREIFDQHRSTHD